MTYAKGNSILATDLNSLAGTNSALVPYASSAAATQKVAALWGVGYGDRGYGQTSPALNPKAVGNPIKAQDFLDLRNAISSIATYQGTAASLLPPVSEFVSGKPIKAEVPATTIYDFPSMIASIDTNRLIAAPANMSVVVNSLNVTRSAAWGGGSTSIVCEVQAAFNSENEARYFFNSGGTLNVTLSHSATTSPQNADWNSILSALGVIKLGARATTRTGSSGTPAAIGYYNLTATYQIVFNGTNIGSSAYAANDVLVEAMTVSAAGVNGGNGTTIKMRITLSDQHTNTWSDTVAAGTVASFGFTKAAQVLTGIPSPTFTAVTNF